MVTSLKVQVSLPSCDARQHPGAWAACCVSIQWHQEGCHLVRILGIHDHVMQAWWIFWTCDAGLVDLLDVREAKYRPREVTVVYAGL